MPRYVAGLYGQRKTANMLFSVVLPAKLGGEGLQLFSLYPGNIVTEIVRRLLVWDFVKASIFHSLLIASISRGD